MWCKIVLPFPLSFSVSLKQGPFFFRTICDIRLARSLAFLFPNRELQLYLSSYVKVAHGIWSFPEIFVFASGYVSTFRTRVQVYLEWLPWLMLIFTFISHFVIDLMSIWSYNFSPLSLQGSVLYTKMLQIAWRFLLLTLTYWSSTPYQSVIRRHAQKKQSLWRRSSTQSCWTRKMVPITGRARSFLLVFKNKIERRERQNKNNRPINLPNVITFSTDFKYTTQSYLYHTQ